MRRSLAALAVAYASFGLFWGAWGVAFADFVEDRGVSFAFAGTLFGVSSIVSILTMVLVAPHLEPLPRYRTVAWSLLLTAAAGGLLVLAPDPLLLVAFLLLGAGTGLVDVFVNAAGQELEIGSGRSSLQQVHAGYSIGVTAGAIVTGTGLSLAVPYRGLLVLAMLAQAAAAAWNWSLSPTPPVLRTTGPGTRLSLSVFVTTPFLLVPALAVTAAFFVEGSMDVWAVLYLRADLAASPIMGSIGLAVFSLSMAAGRLFTAKLLFGLGPRAVLLVSGAGSLASGLIAIGVSRPSLASAAFLVLGFCIAATGPAAYGMVGRCRVHVATATAAVTTVGYIGFVLGPPLLGWLADAVGIRAALAVVVLSSGGILLAALGAPRTGQGNAMPGG